MGRERTKFFRELQTVMWDFATFSLTFLEAKFQTHPTPSCIFFFLVSKVKPKFDINKHPFRCSQHSSGQLAHSSDSKKICLCKFKKIIRRTNKRTNNLVRVFRSHHFNHVVTLHCDIFNFILDWVKVLLPRKRYFLPLI